jgi:hypothetical protein
MGKVCTDGDRGVKRTIKLTGDLARRFAIQQVQAAPDGFVVTVGEPKKKREQEEKYHAMIGDIAKSCEFMGKKWPADDWKRLLVDAFAKVMRDAGTPVHHDGRIVPSLDGARIVQLGIQTSEFYVKEAAEFIEYLYSYGSEHNVRWSEPGFYREAA